MTFSTIQGTGGAPDSFVGTAGVDTIALLNTSGNFVLTAAGNDDIIDFIGTATAPVIADATLRGGDGIDTFNDLNGSTFSSVLINGNAGDDGLFFDGSTFVGSTIQGGQGNDVIELGLISTTIVNGNKGNDDISVDFASQSFVRGGDGNDTIEVLGSQGTIINGNLGNDVITISGTHANSKVQGGDGDDLITVDGDLASSVVNGNKGNDTITLTASLVSFTDSTIFGGEGNDVIDASAVGTTDLILSGDLGNDTITGGDGDDTIIGGAGADLMTGTDGDNTFVFASLADTFTGALKDGDTDVITDFATGTDELDLLITGTNGGFFDDTNVFADYDAAFAAANTYFEGNTHIYFFASNVTAGGNVLFIANGAGSTSASGAINLSASVIAAADIV